MKFNLPELFKRLFISFARNGFSENKKNTNKKKKGDGYQYI